ncbi:PREDICTED: sugar transporter ERD6-like 8 [Ipomoea nil]|uniref:sugar transporter ERD6-like 8 n=1 Tax=Ipomoea nil TaxID=35883 RepID=UPI0009008D79|nr:PREDICTED: sugar transporter ERD6-like 8 [Ipomoea nil]
MSDAERGREVSEPLIGDEESVGMVVFSTIVAVCGSYSFGTCVAYSSPAQYELMLDLNLSYSQYAVFGSILTIGAMLGAITSGRIADLLGRKGAMWLSAIVCIIGWVAIYWAWGTISLYVGRCLTGYAIGIFSYAIPVYIGEITPSKLRGLLSSINQLLIVIGLSATYVIGAFLSWRLLALTGLIPCGILCIGLFFIPESPRWLAMKGRAQEFDAALRKLRGPHADISEEETAIQTSLDVLNGLPKATILTMFDENNIRAVIISVGLMAIQQLGGINGIIFYSEHIFTAAGFNPSLGSILFSLLQVVLTALGAFLMDRAGRRSLLLLSSSGLLLGNLLIAFSFLLQDKGYALDLVPDMAIGGVLVYIAAFSMGMGAVPWIIMSEVFPLHVKGIGGAMVTLMNWITTWAVSFSFTFLMLWSTYGTFLIFAAVCALGIVFIYKMVPETKGRTLEEIHASLNS